MGSTNHNHSLKKVIKEYYIIHSQLQPLVRQIIPEQKEHKSRINNLKSELKILFNKIVASIVNGNINLSGIEKLCEKPLFKQITLDDRIAIYVQDKKDRKAIIDDDYEERLIEFKIICQIVWEDGVVDESEEIEIDNSINELEITKEDADRIFNQIKGEYEETVFDEKVESNQPDIFDKIIKIDNVTFHFKIIDQPMSPLFWHKYENNLEVIYINKTHHQYKDFNTKLLCNLVAVLCKTKLSFSDESGEIFENRFKNYLNLINLKA
jgi:hypothetical protein